jgi:hypothetical protein
VAARAAVPDARAQRRDQHRERQPPLDRGAGGEVALAVPRLRGPAPDLRAGRLRFRVARQRARGAGDGRHGADPRDADPDPAVDRAARVLGPGPRRVLRVPRAEPGPLGARSTATGSGPHAG